MNFSGWTANQPTYSSHNSPGIFSWLHINHIETIVMAMETALLNCSVNEVIKLLKGLLKKQGYEIEEIDMHEILVLAYHNGKWFSQKKHVLFQISSMDTKRTRIDVTASIEGSNKSEIAEEILEEKLVLGIYDLMQ